MPATANIKKKSPPVN